MSSAFPWYLKLQESYYKLLIEAINNPPKDMDAWVKTTADKLRQELASLKSKG
jgi:multiple sugar transport system substrate-binding protein